MNGRSFYEQLPTWMLWQAGWFPLLKCSWWLLLVRICPPVLQGRSSAFDIQKTIHNAPQMLTEIIFNSIQVARFNYFCLVKRYLPGVLEWNTIKRWSLEIGSQVLRCKLTKFLISCANFTACSVWFIQGDKDFNGKLGSSLSSLIKMNRANWYVCVVKVLTTDTSSWSFWRYCGFHPMEVNEALTTVLFTGGCEGMCLNTQDSSRRLVLMLLLYPLTTYK